MGMILVAAMGGTSLGFYNFHFTFGRKYVIITTR